MNEAMPVVVPSACRIAPLFTPSGEKERKSESERAMTSERNEAKEKRKTSESQQGGRDRELTVVHTEPHPRRAPPPPLYHRVLFNRFPSPAWYPVCLQSVARVELF